MLYIFFLFLFHFLKQQCRQASLFIPLQPPFISRPSKMSSASPLTLFKVTDELISSSPVDTFHSLSLLVSQWHFTLVTPRSVSPPPAPHSLLLLYSLLYPPLPSLCITHQISKSLMVQSWATCHSFPVLLLGRLIHACDFSYHMTLQSENLSQIFFLCPNTEKDLTHDCVS